MRAGGMGGRRAGDGGFRAAVQAAQPDRPTLGAHAAAPMPKSVRRPALPHPFLPLLRPTFGSGTARQRKARPVRKVGASWRTHRETGQPQVPRATLPARPPTSFHHPPRTQPTRPPARPPTHLEQIPPVHHRRLHLALPHHLPLAVHLQQDGGGRRQLAEAGDGLRGAALGLRAEGNRRGAGGAHRAKVGGQGRCFWCFGVSVLWARGGGEAAARRLGRERWRLAA